MLVSLIAAMSRNRCIGVENRLPWHLPEDLKRFRRLTTGHPIIMGRKTFDSIGKPLPNRRNFVITRQAGLGIAGVEVVTSLDEALALCRAGERPASEVFVIGGAEIYRLALPRADRLYLTLIDQEVAGDAFFPEWDAGSFREIDAVVGEGLIPHRYVTFERLVAR